MSDASITVFRVVMEWSVSAGLVRQMDAILPDGLSLRVMQTSDGFHVSVGGCSDVVPSPVSAENLNVEIARCWENARAR
jgi:hypothetical protein